MNSSSDVTSVCRYKKIWQRTCIQHVKQIGSNWRQQPCVVYYTVRLTLNLEIMTSTGCPCPTENLSFKWFISVLKKWMPKLNQALDYLFWTSVLFELDFLCFQMNVSALTTPCAIPKPHCFTVMCSVCVQLFLFCSANITLAMLICSPHTFW